MIKRPLAALAAAAAILVGLAPAASAQEDARVVLRPGDGITFSSDPATPGWCSIAALGRDDAGRLIALTAGHCVDNPNVGPNNKPVYKHGEQAAGVLGRTTSVFNGGSVDWVGLVTNNEPDYAALVIDETKARGSNTSLVDAEGQSVAITGTRGWSTTGNANIGSVCSAGYTTKVHCSLESHGIIVRSNLINAYPANSQGDSGGALVDNEGRLLGILTGRTLNYPPNASTRIDVVVADMATKGSFGTGWEPLTTP